MEVSVDKSALIKLVQNLAHSFNSDSSSRILFVACISSSECKQPVPSVTVTQPLLHLRHRIGVSIVSGLLARMSHVLHVGWHRHMHSVHIGARKGHDMVSCKQ